MYATTNPWISVSNSAATLPGEQLCTVCEKNHGHDWDAAAACCGAEKARRQRRIDHLTGIYNRKVAELGRIAQEIEALGGEVTFDD